MSIINSVCRFIARKAITYNLVSESEKQILREFMQSTNIIDLNTCVPGQKLKARDRTILTYIRKLPEDNYYDHEVQYPDGSFGTLMNDGFVFKNKSSRLVADRNIIEIFPPCKPHADGFGTSQANYVSLGDGRVWLNYKNKRSSTGSIAHVTNDNLGRKYINEHIRPFFPKIRLIYRCPKDGMGYDYLNFSQYRRGWVHKKRALIIDVRIAK